MRSLRNYEERMAAAGYLIILPAFLKTAAFCTIEKLLHAAVAPPLMQQSGYGYAAVFSW